MPETRVERVIFALGVVVVAGLIALIVAGRKEEAGAGHRAASTVQRDLTPSTTSISALSTASAPTTTAPSTTAPTRPSRAARTFTLTLAARADSWFEIRAGSATGEVLYSGVLPLGQRRSFTGTRLWARFGGAANLDARLDGRVLALPPGTYSTLVTRRGVEPSS